MASLLELSGLDWSVPDFSTLSRRQKTLDVSIPYRGANGPLHLLVDSAGIKVEGEGSGPRASMAARSEGFGARSILGSTRKRSRSGRCKSLQAMSAMVLYCRTRLSRSLRMRRSPRSPPTAPTIRGPAMTPSLHAVQRRSGILLDRWRSCPHSAEAECEAMEAGHGWGPGTQREPAGIEASWPHSSGLRGPTGATVPSHSGGIGVGITAAAGWKRK